jgi:hypothetical protein
MMSEVDSSPVVRINVNIPGGAKSISTPAGGELIADHNAPVWGYHLSTKNKMMDLLSHHGFDFDQVYMRMDKFGVRRFLVLVGTVDNPIIIWRRFYNHTNTPENMVYIGGKVYTITNFLALSPDQLLKAINPCELKAAIIVESYRQEHLK